MAGRVEQLTAVGVEVRVETLTPLTVLRKLLRAVDDPKKRKGIVRRHYDFYKRNHALRSALYSLDRADKRFAP